MPRSQNPKCHQEEVEHFGVAVQVKQLTPDGNLYVEHRHFDERFRKSLRTKNLEKAREWARNHCKEIALQKEGGALGAAVRSNNLTLGELFDAFRERGMPKYEKKASKTYVSRLSICMELMEHVWGRNLQLGHLDQERVDEFVRHREKEGIQLGERTFSPVTRRTTRADLSCFSTILKWAQKQKLQEDWLLTGASPLKRVDLPGKKPDSEISRPIADEARHAALLDSAEQIGTAARHTGRMMLPMLLRLARHTGRRVQALRNLRWDDICLDREACERALRQDQAPTRYAQEWPHGAIRWRAEHNKMGYGTVIPIREELNQALKRYRRDQWSSVLDRIVGEEWRETIDPSEMPLFPSRFDPTRSVTRTTPHDWLRLAEKVARQAELSGAPPVDEKQGGFHAYRRWWASERSHYSSDISRKAVRLAGGWKPSGDTMHQIYLKVSASELFRVVVNEKSGSHGSGTVSLKVLNRLVADLVNQMKNGTARDAIRQFPELPDQERRRLLWELVRTVEKEQGQTDRSKGSRLVNR